MLRWPVRGDPPDLNHSDLESHRSHLGLLPFCGALLLSICAGSIAFVLLPSAQEGREFTAFGPQTYTRARGAPVPETRSFAVRNAAAAYHIRIRNAGVASARILLNNTEVIGPQAFNRTVALIERPVALRGANVLAVEVRSAPGSFITVEIVGFDSDLPSIVPKPTPAANHNGWNNTPVTVTFECEDVTSGIASCNAPVTVERQGSNQVVTGEAVDVAGNRNTASVTLNIDKTAPTIVPIVEPKVEFGWHRAPPLVRFECFDDLSGIEECTSLPVPAVIGQPPIGFARDRAGNTKTLPVALKIDPDAPVVAITAPADGTTVGTDAVTISGTASDAQSGLRRVSCNDVPASLESANFTCKAPLNDGENLIAVQALDLAGNTASAQIRVWKLRLTIESPVEGAFLSASPVVVRGTVTDPNARVIVQNVIATVTGTTFEAAAVALFEGPNELRARARNVRGGEAVATRSVVRDTIPPVVSITSPAERSIFTEPAAQIAAVVTDATPVSCTVAGVHVPVYAGTFSGKATFVIGPNPVTVGCTDAAGHTTAKAITVYHDPNPLVVTAVKPGHGGVDIAPDSAVVVSFNEPVDPASVNANTFFVRAGSALLPAAVSASPDGLTAVLMPGPAFPAGTAVDIVVTAGITDAAHNPLSSPFASRFTTAVRHQTRAWLWARSMTIRAACRSKARSSSCCPPKLIPPVQTRVVVISFQRFRPAVRSGSRGPVSPRLSGELRARAVRSRRCLTPVLLRSRRRSTSTGCWVAWSRMSRATRSSFSPARCQSTRMSDLRPSAPRDHATCCPAGGRRWASSRSAPRHRSRRRLRCEFPIAPAVPQAEKRWLRGMTTMWACGWRSELRPFSPMLLRNSRRWRGRASSRC